MNNYTDRFQRESEGDGRLSKSDFTPSVPNTTQEGEDVRKEAEELRAQLGILVRLRSKLEDEEILHKGKWIKISELRGLLADRLKYILTLSSTTENKEDKYQYFYSGEWVDCSQDFYNSLVPGSSKRIVNKPSGIEKEEETDESLFLMSQIALHSAWRQLNAIENKTEQQKVALSIVDNVLDKVAQQKKEKNTVTEGKEEVKCTCNHAILPIDSSKCHVHTVSLSLLNTNK